MMCDGGVPKANLAFLALVVLDPFPDTERLFVGEGFKSPQQLRLRDVSLCSFRKHVEGFSSCLRDAAMLTTAFMSDLLWAWRTSKDLNWRAVRHFEAGSSGFWLFHGA